MANQTVTLILYNIISNKLLDYVCIGFELKTLRSLSVELACFESLVRENKMQMLFWCEVLHKGGKGGVWGFNEQSTFVGQFRWHSIQ